MNYEVEKYNNLKYNVNGLAREINLAISDLGTCRDLFSNFMIDENSKEKVIISEIVEELNSINSVIRYNIIPSIDKEIDTLSKIAEI